jgi:CheY-like chemotaxis protein
VRRVLVLDDEPLIAMLIKDWLEELGYEALGPAHSVSQALAAIEGDNPDAALLDVSLGDTDSYRVADVLKTRNIPFAFGTGRDERAIESRHKGVPILTKPYDVNSLEAILAKLLPSR